MHRAELSKLIQSEEGSTVEFKTRMPPPDALAQTLVGMANVRGGYILIGVDNEGRITGTVMKPETLEVVARVAEDLCRPSLDVGAEVVGADDRQVLVLTVKPGVGPYQTRSGDIYVRSGAATHRASPDGIARLYMKKGLMSFEELPIQGATREDLAMEAFDAYLTRRSGRQIKDDASVGELLVKLRFCVRQDHQIVPTVAGMLLFGKTPQRFLPQSGITAARVQGSDRTAPIAQRREIEGRLSEILEGAFAFVETHMRRATRIEGFRREEIPEYPLTAVREVLVNAATHRDYSLRGARIQVWMFEDRWEIASPGGLPWPMTTATLGQDRTFRNPLLMDAMRAFGYAEGLGVGINRMRRTLQEGGYEEPIFEETGDVFRVVIHSSLESQRMQTLLTQYRDRLDRSGGNERQFQALAYLSRHPTIVNRTYRKLTGVSSVTALRDLQGLVDLGILERIGEKRGAYYVLREAVT